MHREHTELGAAGDLGRILDLEPEPQIGLVRPVAEHRVRIREPRERPLGWLSVDSFETRDDHALQHLQHVLAGRERELEVELTKLELAVGAEILVPPAGRDLVVAVEPADHEQLLEELRRLG